MVNAKKLILIKNDGNLIQEFFWDASNMERPEIQPPEGIRGRERERGLEAAKQDGQHTAEGLKTLGTLLVTNGQFRKLCMQYLIPPQDYGVELTIFQCEMLLSLSVICLANPLRKLPGSLGLHKKRCLK